MKNIKNYRLKKSYLWEKIGSIVWIIKNNNEIKIRDKRIIWIGQWFYFSVIAFAIFFSLIILAIPKSQQAQFHYQITLFQLISAFILIGDYILLWWTSAINYPKNTKYPRIKFLFSFTSFFLIIGILSSLYPIEFFINNGKPIDFFHYVQALSFIKMFRVIMLFKMFKSFRALFDVFKSQKVVLINVFIFIVVLILFLALMIWNIEVHHAEAMEWGQEGKDPIPTNIVRTYWDAIYFTTITLTTIGYGDIVPYADATKSIVIIISLIGIAIFAIPSGVIAGSFLSEIQKANAANKKEKEHIWRTKKNNRNVEKQSKELVEETDKQE